MTPVDGSFEVPFSFNRNGVETKGVNIVGNCRGSGAGQRPVDGPTVAPVMVVSAHYDHLGVRDGAIYHGADDNASGVAVVLALARHCQRTPWTHDVVFVAFDAEEMGLQGARAFVAAPPVAKERIALNVNLDMVSRSATQRDLRSWDISSPGVETAARAGRGSGARQGVVRSRPAERAGRRCR